MSDRTKLPRSMHFKKKRLRKKYHQGEFQELGFAFDAEWSGHFDDESYDRANDAVLDQVDKLGLDCGGSFGPKGVSLFICKHKGTCTQQDIDAFTKLVADTGFVTNVKTSKLVDVWYGEP